MPCAHVLCAAPGGGWQGKLGHDPRVVFMV